MLFARAEDGWLRGSCKLLARRLKYKNTMKKLTRLVQSDHMTGSK
jgi:hypothetical protein